MWSPCLAFCRRKILFLCLSIHRIKLWLWTRSLVFLSRPQLFIDLWSPHLILYSTKNTDFFTWHHGSVEAEQSQGIIVIDKINRVTLSLHDFSRNNHFLIDESDLDLKKATSLKGELKTEERQRTQIYFNSWLLVEHASICRNSYDISRNWFGRFIYFLLLFPGMKPIYSSLKEKFN